MQLNDGFDGSRDAFEGDRTLLLRSLPANVRVTKATVRVTPAAAPAGTLFEESLTFGSTGVGTFGTTKATGNGFVEVDFHKRRTLATVTGVTGANLQVDMGGVYLEINANGAIKGGAGDSLLTVPSDGTLPGLTVSKFKLTLAGNPDVSKVTIRSVPTNVSVRFGAMPPFWTRVGEMTQEEVSPDFAAVLQVFLADAKVGNGFYAVPLVLHSDSLARLSVQLEIDFIVDQSASPAGVNDVLLSFGMSGRLQTPNDPSPAIQPLTLTVPANARVAKGGVSGRVTGAFEETRILYSPASVGMLADAVGEVIVSGTPPSSAAQSSQSDKTLTATAVDLLLTVKRTGGVQLDLREDLDGKPGSASLLPSPVRFELAGPVALQPGSGTKAEETRWITVQLSAAVQFQAGKIYWLVLQSIEGEAGWTVGPSNEGNWQMQRTEDGGLSWRPAGVSGPVAAFFRLRGRPESFTMPIALEVGRADPTRSLQPQLVAFDRFAASGRVDFTLDIDEVSDAINQHLDKVAPATCPEGEHLINGDFEQWLRIGDELMKPTTIDLDVQPEALAISPNGLQAYVVGATTHEADLLQIVDVICGTVSEEQDIQLDLIPTLIVVSPDESRAYVVVQDTELQVIDLDARQVLGAPFSLEHSVIAAALSQDGGLLFFSMRVETTVKIEVMVVDTAGLEKFARSGGPKPVITQPPETLPLISILSRGLPNGKFAVTPDGKWAVVLVEEGTKIIVIDMETRRDVTSISISKSAAVAISPDGTYAYVANQDANTVSVIDLRRRVVVGDAIPVDLSPTAIALTPNSDRILVTHNRSTSLSSIQIGSRQPHEWNLVSGQVMPYCLPEPCHLVAFLSSQTKENQTPSTLSQMVPVAESCPYQIHFLGIASSEGATAEVRWLDQNSTLIGSDPERIPIEANPVAFKKDPNEGLDDAALTPLPLHRKRLPAPEGATQAEIRFVVPMGVAAAIDNVSFHATTEAVVNSDFSLREDDRLAGWSLSPGAARSVSLLAIDSGIRLQNAGTETVELVQTIPANRSQLFELQVESAVLRAKLDGNPRVEVHWLKDGVPLTEEIVLDIPMESFSALRTNGTSPETATQAEIHLIVPPGATQELRRVSMTFTPTVTVPLTFIAQAPGELTVSALRAAFEKEVTLPPPIPDTGLFMPAPAQANGEAEPGEGGCFCACCKSTEPMINATTMTTEAGRPVQVGGCPTCGDQLVRFGGPLIPNAPRFALRRELAEEPVVLTRGVARLAPHQEDAHAATPLPKLVDIVHIGEARERRLVAAGINSVAKLAAIPAKRVVELLKPGVSEEMARKFIQDAARLAKG